MPDVDGIRYRSTLRFLYEALEGLVLAPLVIVTWPVCQRWLSNWGSTPDERGRTWPGDAHVADPEVINTRAVAVAAPPEAIWPWIVQFGLGRAGFYSYELLERLVGIPVRNVESIVPDFQTLDVGDEVKLHPTAPGVPVAEVRASEYVCFGVSEALAERFDRPDPARSWSMYLVPEGGDRTRLVLRSCIEAPSRRTLVTRAGRTIEESVDFLMEQRMLRTLRRLARADR